MALANRLRLSILLSGANRVSNRALQAAIQGPSVAQARPSTSLCISQRSFGLGSEQKKLVGLQLGQRRYFTKWLIDRRLKKLEKAATVSNDAHKELEFVRELNRHYPEAVIRRLDSGKIPMNEPLLKEYLKALAQLKALDRVNLNLLLQKVKSMDPALLASLVPTASGAVGATGAAAGTGSLAAPSVPAFLSGISSKDPLFVQIAEPTWKSHAWRTVRTLLYFFIIMSLIGAFLDERGISSRVGGGAGSAIHQAQKSNKTFADVVGVDEAKSELQEIVMYLKDPEKFTRFGGQLPKGMLLTGPPGTGKTLLARAIAGEAGVPFFYASGSEFEEMYVGVGARRVRDLFEAAKKQAPCIIFIDEIDAIGGSRHLKEQQAMKMTLNQLLVEMDGFEQNNGVIVIAATNFAESLDAALTRPGRFDRHVAVPLPDVRGRQQILELYASSSIMDEDVDLEVLARGTPGFSGADLFNLINQAALKASIDGAKAITMATLEYAKDKILMGAERKSAMIAPETARMTAFHEGGHALVALKTDGADPIHKATIMPRGRALGMVMQLPEGDQTSMSKKQMLAKLDVCMGGRVAEELVFGSDNVTSGASSDIQQATKLARAMITHYGFSDKVGIVWHDKNEEFSPETRKLIDDEVRRLLQESYNRAKHVLETNREELNLVAAALMEYETLSGHEIAELLAGKPINAARRTHRPSQLPKQPPAGPPKRTQPKPGHVRPKPLPIPVPEPASREPAAQRPAEKTTAEERASR